MNSAGAVTVKVTNPRPLGLDYNSLYSKRNFNGELKNITLIRNDRKDNPTGLYTKEDFRFMKEARNELAKAGYNDVDISHILSYVEGWHPMGVHSNILSMVRNNELPENPNRSPEPERNLGC